MRKAGRLVLVSVLLWLLVGAVPAVARRDCDATSIGLVPITDLGETAYLGEQGGLYPNGANVVPEAHLELGLRLSRLVGPLNSQGDIDPAGSIGLVSIGVSNTRIEFARFIDVVVEDTTINPQLIMINGAQGSRPLEDWAEGPQANPWYNLAVYVNRAGITSEQVQVAWIKLPMRSRGTDSLEDAGEEVNSLAEVVRIAKGLYPNLRLVYLSSRTYGGYGGGADSEPKAYQNGFAVKWLIERQIEVDPTLNADPDVGPVEAPWLGWGPYLWADGITPRSDDLVWMCEDFTDGIHPGPDGADKVADLLLAHFMTHSTSADWFVHHQSATPPAGDTTTTLPTTTSTPVRRGNSSERPRSDEQRRSSQPRTPAAQGADLFDDAAWLVAGAALGLGVSLSVVLVVHARRESARGVTPSDDL